MTTTEFHNAREALLDRQERRACLFVASCSVLLTVAWVGFLIAALV